MISMHYKKLHEIKEIKCLQKNGENNSSGIFYIKTVYIPYSTPQKKIPNHTSIRTSATTVFTNTTVCFIE